MKIGWVGLGKLGVVCAAVLAKHGHEVRGYDPFSSGQIPSYEEGAAGLTPVPPEPELDPIVADVEVIFVAVQTPHSPEYGGGTPAPEARQDFEYGYLVSAVRAIVRAAERTRETDNPLTLAIVSTVLPGTMNRLIRPILSTSRAAITLVYCPAFIAMGTTVADYENPEMVLLGSDQPRNTARVWSVMAALPNVRSYQHVTIENAEMIKVVYNTYISQKIVFGNMLMELCEKTGADCDMVVDALEHATDRVISARYLRGGVGDGGACHPRDLIAMSWLSQRLDLSVDLMGFLVAAREVQSGWLGEQAVHWSELLGGAPITLLGIGYKPRSPLRAGSPSDLLASQLRAAGHEVWQEDPYIDPALSEDLDTVGVFVIMTKHPEFVDYEFAPGSVVLDPHGYIPDQEGVQVIRLGRK